MFHARFVRIMYPVICGLVLSRNVYLNLKYTYDNLCKYQSIGQDQRGRRSSSARIVFVFFFFFRFVFVFVIVLVIVFMGLYLIIVFYCCCFFYFYLKISKYLTRPEVEAFFISSSGLVFTFDTRARTCTNSWSRSSSCHLLTLFVPT